MGGCLSGTLANIYLSDLENHLSKDRHILLYKRYMDDILMISYFTNEELNEFVNNLKCSFGLNLTSASHNLAVNYLDMTIRHIQSENKLYIEPFSKNPFIYPFPSTNSLQQDRRILSAQILRVWRICSWDLIFSRITKEFLDYIYTLHYYQKFRKHIFNFLRPVRLSTNKWTTSIPLCLNCKQISISHSISVLKIMSVHGQFIATRKPLNCFTPHIFVIQQTQQNVNLLRIPSLHYFLDFLQFSSRSNFNILPLGKLSNELMKNLLKKHDSIQFCFKDAIKKPITAKPCLVHQIFRRCDRVYGIPTVNKKRQKIVNFFNKFKHFSDVNK